MSKLVTRLKHLFTDESGPTSVEYAILLAVLVATIIGGVLTTGQLQNQMWTDTASDMGTAIQGGNVGN